MSTYEISKSSLLSLKAEIIRKQEEVAKAKLENKHKKPAPSKGSPLDLKGSKKNKVSEELIDEHNSEDEDLLKKSRAALEAKSKLYDKLTKTAADCTSEEYEYNRRYLVQFDKKSRYNENEETREDKYPSSEEDEIPDDYDQAQNSDDEWVEYTDCLGRTRTCLRKDLEFLKAKDNDLKLVVEKKPSNQTTNNDSDLEPHTNESETSTLASELLSTDMRREQLRQQWEEQEIELMKKNDVHYQDILFNEARTHGVGYYGFSKNEDERARQQEALRKLRQETENQQNKAQELKAMREKQIAARVKAARNRKRARMGLPPEEDEQEMPAKEESEPPKEEDKVDEEKEHLEKLKETARKKHVRPWDLGKEKNKEHYEYSQEEWMDKQRKERISEFAPPTFYSNRSNNKTSSISKTMNKNSKSFNTKFELKNQEPIPESSSKLFFTTKSVDTNRQSTIYISRRNAFGCGDDEDSDEPDRLLKDYQEINKSNNFQSTSNYKQQNTQMEPVPIINECVSGDDESDRLLNDYKESLNTTYESKSNEENNRKGVEIPPPPTFEYYNSELTKKPGEKRKLDTEESIMAGLKFLRQQVEKKERSKNHPSEMFLL